MQTEPQIDKHDPLGLQIQGMLGAVIAFRTRMFLSGVLFPIGCFVFTMDSPPTINSPWQSGQSSDYVAMLLTWPGYTPFFPLLVFSQICFSVWLFVPSSANHLVVRLGIYGGFVLTLQFLSFVMLTSAIMTFVIAAFVGPIIALIVALCVRLPKYAKRFAIRHVMILTAVIAVLITLLQLAGVPLSQWFMIVLGAGLYVLMATPALCALAYGRATIAVATQSEFKTQLQYVLPATITWVVAWGVAWKFAVDLMLVEYSKLPTTDPNCYVSNAAAHGHQEFVGAHERLACGQPVNMQMRRLKFLEFALKNAAPHVHAGVRRVYDHVGPRLASVCQQSTWFADATYLLLRPLELVAETIRILACVRPAAIEKIYATKSTEQSIV